VAQINLHTTPEFERALARLMKLRGLATRSQAIRAAVEEAAARADSGPRPDFMTWIGASLVGPENAAPRFASNADLWRDG
jgi:hypothetical protein